MKEALIPLHPLLSSYSRLKYKMSLFQQSSRNPPVSSCSFNLFSFILSYFLLVLYYFPSASGSFVFSFFPQILIYTVTGSSFLFSTFYHFPLSFSIYIRRGQSTFPLTPSSPCLSDTNFFYQSHSSLFSFSCPVFHFLSSRSCIRFLFLQAIATTNNIDWYSL